MRLKMLYLNPKKDDAAKQFQIRALHGISINHDFRCLCDKHALFDLEIFDPADTGACAHVSVKSPEHRTRTFGVGVVDEQSVEYVTADLRIYFGLHGGKTRPSEISFARDDDVIALSSAYDKPLVYMFKSYCANYIAVTFREA